MTSKDKDSYKAGFNFGFLLAESGVEFPVISEQSDYSKKARSWFLLGIEDGRNEIALAKKIDTRLKRLQKIRQRNSRDHDLDR